MQRIHDDVNCIQDLYSGLISRDLYCWSCSCWPKLKCIHTYYNRALFTYTYIIYKYLATYVTSTLSLWDARKLTLNENEYNSIMMIWYMYFRTNTFPKMFKSNVINFFFLFPESKPMVSKMKGVKYYLSWFNLIEITVRVCVACTYIIGLLNWY